jgi:hypothetical protein
MVGMAFSSHTPIGAERRKYGRAAFSPLNRLSQARSADSMVEMLFASQTPIGAERRHYGSLYS